MRSTSELSGFAARLREAILASEWGIQSEPPHAGGCGIAFDESALELFTLQFKHNAPYRRWCEARGATPATVRHWTQIPAAPTVAFKELDLSCLPVAERTTVFHSSGTTGQRPSRHYHCAGSLALYEASLWRWFEANLQSPIANRQLLSLTPPPAQAPHSSLVHMFETIRRECSSGGSNLHRSGGRAENNGLLSLALSSKGGEGNGAAASEHRNACQAQLGGADFLGTVAADGAWTLDVEAARGRLRAACGSGQPLLVLGTAFSFVHLLDDLAEHDLRFALPPGSCALETGGYKGRSRSLPKAALHALITERLGIPPIQIICEYGMSELSSQAYDSATAPSRTTLHATRNTQHAPRPFHFPPWARVQIVSPETGREVAEGETGLIRVFDLANVYSVMAIQTEDLGIRRGDGFALAGRAVLAEPRGCSLLAV